MAAELNAYEVARLEAQAEQAEKIANASLHQRAAMVKLIGRLTDALTDIEELVEDKVDIDWEGNPNLAMQVQTVVRHVIGLGKKSW